MRHVLFYTFFLGISISSFAQVIGDCNGAIVLCGDLYSEDQAPLTAGNGIEWTGGCNNGVEQNSVWYTFTVQSDGELAFEITPNNLNDDYDWGLFNITEGGCAGISLQDGSSPEVSCNSWGTFGVNGTTGISTAQGGVSNSGGPGDLNGPPFNADLPVQDGEVYALVVMNWSNSQDGYTIDFAESTASLYDDISPVLISATTDCANQTFTLTFSEPIVIFSVDLLDFSISGPGGTFSAFSVDSQTPNASYDSVLVVTFEDQISVPGTYTLNILDSGGYVEDPCGNLAINTLDIVINEPILVDVETTEACNGTNGGFEIVSIEGGQSPFEIYMDNVLQNGEVFEGLDAGFYEVLILDDLECEVSLTIEVPNHQLDVVIPQQSDLVCNNGIFLNGITIEPDQLVDILWTFEPGNGNIVSGANTLNPLIDEPGIYTITVTSTIDGCTYSEDLEIEAGLVDQIPPTIVSAQADCGSNTITIAFSEPVVTASVVAGDFEITGGIDGLDIASVTPLQIDSDFETEFTITLTDFIAQSGNYAIELTNTEEFILDQCGNAAIGTFEIDLYAALTFEAVSTIACNGINGTIEVTNIDGGEAPYTFLLNNQVQNELLVDDLDDGDYTVEVEDEHGCSFETSIEVPASFIAIAIPLQDSLSCENPIISIQGLTVTPAQSVNYEWSVFGNTGLISSGSATSSPNVNEPGIYQVVVTGTDSGCEATTNVEVPSGEVYGVDLSTLTFPNVVTLNSDGKNDYWSPFLAANPDFDLGSVFDSYELRIYNRWGNLIYESSGGRVEWELTDVNEGSYFYTVKYASNCGEEISDDKEGVITVLR